MPRHDVSQLHWRAASRLLTAWISNFSTAKHYFPWQNQNEMSIFRDSLPALHLKLVPLDSFATNILKFFWTPVVLHIRRINSYDVSSNILLFSPLLLQIIFPRTATAKEFEPLMPLKLFREQTICNIFLYKLAYCILELMSIKIFIEQAENRNSTLRPCDGGKSWSYRAQKSWSLIFSTPAGVTDLP